MRILLVEGEARMAEALRHCLAEDGHLVSVSGDGREGLTICLTGEFDLVILDAMLLGMSGLEVARRLRAQQNQIPILMLTAGGTTGDIVAGLDVGANDHLNKPLSLDVLIARVRAVGRRGPVAQPASLRLDDLTLDRGSRQVHRRGRHIELTRTEFAILELLLRNTGRVVTRDALIEGVWGGDSEIESNTVDSFVRVLRGKIESPGESRLIRTVRGVGYCAGAKPE